jgi:hypothetical protein
MALQPIIMPILSLFRSAGVTQARSALLGLNKDFNHFAQSVGKSAAAFAAFQGLAGAREFAVTSVEVTQRFERNMLALQQVFEEITPQLASFTREVENYGLSQSRAAQASVFLGSVLKQYGISTEESAIQTQRLVKLSQDLATTFGYDVQEALLAVTALFRGEYDPIEKFGVAMKQSEINARMAADGLVNLTVEEEALAMAQTRLTMLFERASDSIGAYARASDTLYVAQQQLGAVMENMQIAFGESLQKPIANVINQFTEFAQKYGPDVADIGKAIGEAIDGMAPLFKTLSESFFLLIAPLESVVRLLGLVGNALSMILTPLISLVNGALRDFSTLLNFLVLKSDEFNASLERLNLGGSDLVNWLRDVVGLDDTISFFDSLENSIRNAFDEMERLVDQNRNNEFTESARDAAMLDGAIRNFRAAVKETAAPLTYFQHNLQLIGTYSKDAEGKLTGLAALFIELEEAAEQSKAAEALQKIGFEASQIEEILTRPDWATIFGEISRAAAIALLPMGEAIAQFGAGVYFSAIGILDRIKSGLRRESGGAKTAATDFIKEFFNGIDEEIRKQEARVRLERMGASEGLIDAILGSQGWSKVFQRVIRDGVAGLKTLQAEFNRTGAGIEELTKKTEAFEEAQQKALKAAQDEIDRNAAALQRLADEAQKAYERAVEAADNFLYKMKEISQIDILPNSEEEIGRFEAQIIGSIDRIRSELKTAFRDKLIYQEDFDAISAWATAEEFELRRIAQLRDDLANRFALSEALIGDYKRALTAGLQLTGLLSQIKTQTEKRMVTEVQEGMVTIGDSMRQFAVSVTKSYEETIDKTVSKSEGLLQGFRDMAVKAREFAENLRKLRQMGLDPMLFDQLVQAGVVAGGETAQALVDGGQASVNEISSIFQELNELGGSLGEEVAASLYGSGIDMVDGLLAGIRSQQDALLEQARAMARAFSDEFNSRVTVAAGKPVEAARQAAETAQSVATQASQANAAALAEIDRLIANANKALGGNLPSSFVPGIQQKLGGFEALRADILAGQVQDISGITAGMTSAEAAAALKGTGGTTVNNYYEVNVKTDATQSNAMVGQAIASTFDTFVRNGGQVLVGASR